MHMNTLEFENFLHTQIPITKAMGFKVLEFTPDSVKISAPLEPNINHKLTAFGGSINCLMTVCGWALTYANIKPVEPDAHVVIGKSSIKYLLPIKGVFIGDARLEKNDRKKFVERYEKYKRSVLDVACVCYEKDVISAKFNAQYIVFKERGRDQ